MVKVISLLLGVGGVAGIIIGLWTYTRMVSQTGIRPSGTAAVLGLLILVCGWSTWTGVDLWRRKPGAYKWAKMLLALQIPNISTAAFSYQFYTGLTLYLSFTREVESKLGVEFQLGSSLAIYIAPGTEKLIFGVNLIAITALIYLLKVSQQMPTHSGPTSGNELPMNELIAKAVSILRNTPAPSEDGVYKELVASGVESRLAGRLVEFVPMAYGRFLLSKSGARFADTFQRKLPNGSISPAQLLITEPIWNAALEFVSMEVRNGVSVPDFLAIAARSAEFQAANQLLAGGSKLEDLVFTPQLLLWPEDDLPV